MSGITYRNGRDWHDAQPNSGVSQSPETSAPVFPSRTRGTDGRFLRGADHEGNVPPRDEVPTVKPAPAIVERHPEGWDAANADGSIRQRPNA